MPLLRSFWYYCHSSYSTKRNNKQKQLTKLCIQAGLIAASGLTLVYLSLAFIGSSSVQAIGYRDNGGEIISQAATYLFGQAGTAILSVIIMLACLTTSVGLLSSCASYFRKFRQSSLIECSSS